MNNVAIANDLYDAFGRMDEARLRALLHPEVEWIQCAGFPGGGHRHGAEEVLEKVFGALSSEWGDWRVDVDEVLDAGNAVVVLGKYAGTHGETSRSMEAVFAHVYDVEDGRCCMDPGASAAPHSHDPRPLSGTTPAGRVPSSG